MDVAAVFYGLRYGVRIEECIERERLAGSVQAGSYSIFFALHFDNGTARVSIVIRGYSGRVLLELSRGYWILINMAMAAIGRDVWIVQRTRRVHYFCFISALSYLALFQFDESPALLSSLTPRGGVGHP